MKSIGEKMNDLAVAISEAERFLERAKNLQLRLTHDHYYYGRYSASAKRASMDLTMALAEFRKS